MAPGEIFAVRAYAAVSDVVVKNVVEMPLDDRIKTFMGQEVYE